MAATDISPNFDNFTIYTAILYWTPLGGVERDCGDADEFAVTITPSRLPKFSGRGGVSGVSIQVANPVNRVACSVAIKMTEITASNLQMAFLASRPSEGPPVRLDILGKADFRGQFRCRTTNSQGPKVEVILPLVSVAPNAPINFINPTAWADIGLLGEVYGDPTTQIFGTVDWDI